MLFCVKCLYNWSPPKFCLRIRACSIEIKFATAIYHEFLYTMASPCTYNMCWKYLLLEVAARPSEIINLIAVIKRKSESISSVGRTTLLHCCIQCYSSSDIAYQEPALHFEFSTRLHPILSCFSSSLIFRCSTNTFCSLLAIGNLLFRL